MAILTKQVGFQECVPRTAGELKAMIGKMTKPQQ